MKKFFLTLFLVSSLINSLQASKATLAVGKIKADTPKTKSLSVFLEKHLENIINSTQIFDLVNPKLLRSELEKFDCLKEPCLLNFARQAKISVFIFGQVEDLGDFVFLTISSFGTEIPYQGKTIYKYKVKIPLQGNFSSREYSYLCEEEASNYITKFLLHYQEPIKINKFLDEHLTLKLETKENINGSFKLYSLRPQKESSFIRYQEIGSILVEHSLINKTDLEILPSDFILYSYKDQASFLKDFHEGRKKEIIFDQPSIEKTLYKVIFTPTASMSMPLAAPFFGYYANNDWSGLGLWALNSSPYLYLEYKGLDYHFNISEKKLSRQELTQKRFAYYFLFMGGTSLFVDAFAHQYLKEAASYQQKKPIMGSSFSAGYLSLISGGGGLFYRGYRNWGYFYFHLNNILLYLAIREFTPKRTYNAATNTVSEKKIDKKKAYSLAGSYALLKIVEISHAVLVNDNIKSSQLLKEEYSFSPTFYLDENYKINYGLQYSYNW